MVTEKAYLKKSVFLYRDMIIKKGEGSEGSLLYLQENRWHFSHREKRNSVIHIKLEYNIFTSLPDNLQ